MAASPAAQNPFHERCLLETARLFFDLGDTAKSLERFQSLAASATTAEFREEAIVRGGLMAAEAGKPEESEKLLAEALKFPTPVRGSPSRASGPSSTPSPGATMTGSSRSTTPDPTPAETPRTIPGRRCSSSSATPSASRATTSRP